MKKVMHLDLLREHDSGPGQGPIQPATPGGSRTIGAKKRVHTLLFVADRGMLVSGLQDLRFTLTPNGDPKTARIGIYQGNGMFGEILFLEKIQLASKNKTLFALDAATVQAANRHLVPGNSVGIEVALKDASGSGSISATSVFRKSAQVLPMRRATLKKRARAKRSVIRNSA